MIKGDLLIISPSFIEDLDNIFYDEYNIHYAKSCSMGIIFLEKKEANISVILLSDRFSLEEETSFLDFINSNMEYMMIPIILFSDDDHVPMEKILFDKGVIECIKRPYNKRIHLNRIQNVINFKNALTYPQMEGMISKLPISIFLKDTECKYVFCSQYWHQLQGYDEEGWSIKGKTDLECRRDKANAIKAYNEDKSILKTGEGTRYVIDSSSENHPEFLEIVKEPVHDSKGNIIGIIGLINNITASELARRDLEKKANIDDMTGIFNRDFFNEYIENINPENYPITVISADCDNLKKVNDTYGHQFGDEYIKMAVILFKMFISDNGIFFRIGGDEFVIIMNNTPIEKAEKLVLKMEAKMKLFFIKDIKLSLSFGVACLKDDTTSIKDIIKISDDEMYKKKKIKKEEGL